MLKSLVRSLSFSIALIIFVVLLQTPAITNAELAREPKTSVYDVKIGGLNVRTGPGFAYPVIAQVSYGEDIVNYCPATQNSCASVSGNGQEWKRNYYPDSNIGYYSNAALGYMAWYITAEQGNWNYYYTDGAWVSRTSTIYRDACPNLSGSSGITVSKGQYLNAYYKDYELYATECNPNAWRIHDKDANTDGYVNGWNLKAE
ncbi:hypothetical protein [Paenibacillus sp. F4]|uniref:hypothetical protein n=1 Tax=Paenibacillus sp. F4 TaxID=357385 RepID=UPI000C9FD49F|nr:hypothetical protein [Paenibacillus sp. F4]PNQ78852.1 hypothetical protein C1T21_22655 [Paenibacillus sp. F4]